MGLDSEFNENIHLEPEMTWRDCATFLYDAVIEGKLSRDAFIEFFSISGQEMLEPRNVKIFAKALSTFFKRDYSDLKSDEHPNVFVIVDGKKYLVGFGDKKITIHEADDLYDIPDRSFIISHDTVADAKIAAWVKREKYIEAIS